MSENENESGLDPSLLARALLKSPFHVEGLPLRLLAEGQEDAYLDRLRERVASEGSQS